MLRATVVWIAVNLLFDRFLGFPRYRYDVVTPSIEVPDNADAPRFLQRLPNNVSADEVIALKAEQHYVRVYTAGRSFMTLYRFSDAVAELDPERGLQVHRSYWVNTSAIKAIKRGPKKLQVLFDSGMTVPVSGPYRGLVEQLARSEKIPVTPLI